jgi:hypothetical protein
LRKSTRRHHAPLSLLNVPVRVPVRVPEKFEISGVLVENGANEQRSAGQGHAHGQGHVQQAEPRKGRFGAFFSGLLAPRLTNLRRSRIRST